MVYYLLCEGSDVSHKSVHGYDALFLATQLGFFETVFVLLNHGSNPDTTDPNGDTPFYWTIKFEEKINTVEIQRLLKSFGTNVGHKNNNLDTALHILAHSKAPFDPYLALIAYGDGSTCQERNSAGKTPYEVPSSFNPISFIHE